MEPIIEESIYEEVELGRRRSIVEVQQEERPQSANQVYDFYTFSTIIILILFFGFIICFVLIIGVNHFFRSF